MKNLLWFIPFLAFFACHNLIDSKEKTCPQYEKGSYGYLQDSMRQGLGATYYERGNLNKAVDMKNYDTIYRYRSCGGWGDFDNICSIYRQMDTPQYKVQLLKQRARQDTIYDVSEKTLTRQEWQNFRKRFEETNFWCYVPANNGGCIDCNTYTVVGKEGNKKRHIFWSGDVLVYNTLRGLGMDMLELANYPMPYSRLLCKKEKDSISVEIIPSDFDNSFVKKYDFKSPFKEGKLLDGVYKLKIHKKDFNKLNDIEMVVECYNGRIRTTTEKKIEKTNF